MLDRLNNVQYNGGKSMLVFVLTAAMQAAFLGREAVKQVLGYDFTKPEDRAAYIKKLVDILYKGAVQTDESKNRNG